MSLSPAGRSLVAAVTAEAFDVLGTGRQIAPFSQRHAGFDLDAAYRVTVALRSRREARGERVVGRKIGFTNRTIWAEYGVYAPIWGYVYDRTVHDLTRLDQPFDLSWLAEPRIEPEIVFGLVERPRPQMNEADLLGCVGWVAHGFEIVQSIFPAWRFTAADTVAAYGLHGALLLGQRHEISGDRDPWLRHLQDLEIELFRDGVLMDRGRAANVLDGPLSALKHLVTAVEADDTNSPLDVGDIITTGTLTRAFPIGPGENWTTVLSGIGLDGIDIRF